MFLPLPDIEYIKDQRKDFRYKTKNVSAYIKISDSEQNPLFLEAQVNDLSASGANLSIDSNVDIFFGKFDIQIEMEGQNSGFIPSRIVRKEKDKTFKIGVKFLKDEMSLSQKKSIEDLECKCIERFYE